MVAQSQCVWPRCLLVGVPVVLGDGLGYVFVFVTVQMGVVFSGGGRPWPWPWSSSSALREGDCEPIKVPPIPVGNEFPPRAIGPYDMLLSRFMPKDAWQVWVSRDPEART